MHVVNDGSVSGSPCQVCSGKLILRSVRGSGFFLGCSNFQKLNCRFTMDPNHGQLRELAVAALERREARAARAELKVEKEREREAWKRRNDDVFCSCGEALTSMRRFARETLCDRCAKVGV